MRRAELHTRLAAAMSEDDLTEELRTLCAALGVTRYHHRDSRRTTAGWPDEALLVRGAIAYRELKTEAGRVTAAQQRCLDDLAAAGQDVGVWRPRHFFDGTMARELAALVARGRRARAA